MFRNYKIVFLFLSYLFTPVRVVSQDYAYTNFSEDQGLIQSQVRAVLQDSKGFLWIGTMEGLSCFDGKNFYNYTIFDGLVENRINSIFEDGSQNIWIGTLGAICLFNNHKFESFYLDNQYKSLVVQCFLKVSDDEFWLGTEGSGIISFNSKTQRFTSLSQFNSISYVRHMFRDSKDNIWFATRNGLFLYNEKTLSPIHLDGDTANCSYIAEDYKKNIWISTYGSGIIKISEKDTAALIFNVSDPHNFRKVTFTSDNTLWAASKKGILRIKEGGALEYLTEQNGLVNQNIWEIYEDQEKNVWLGTDGNGLLMYKGAGILNYYEKNGICSNQMMTFCEDNQNNFWLGTHENGICQKKGDKYYTFNVDNGLINNTIWCSYKDSKGNLWFGTADGVTMYDGKRMIDFHQHFNTQGVYSISEDHNGNIWFAVNDGLISFQNGVFKNFFDLGSDARKTINAVFAEGKNLWIGSGFGLLCYKNDQFLTYKIPSVNKSKTKISSLYADKTAYVWAGTSNGLYAFHKERKTFAKIYLGEEYKSNSVTSLTKDHLGFLWVGTYNGVFRIDPKVLLDSNTPNLHLLKGDGLPSLECNVNAIYTDLNGYIWVGTAAGTSRIDPNFYLTKENTNYPKIWITDIKLFLEPIIWKNVDADFNTRSEIPSYFKLPYEKNYLTFDFIGLFYKNPEKIYYRFKLEGFDKEYSPLVKTPFATYSNLSPGDYTFQVISSFDLKNWSQPAEIQFTILPPYWLRWWFILIVFILIASLAYLIHYTRSNIRKRKMEAEKFSYHARLLELEQQALNASMNRHFVFNSLNSIQYYINSQDKKSANLYLTKFAKLIRKNLDDLQSEHVTLKEEIERVELYLSLEQMRFEGDFEYKIHVAEEVKEANICIPSMMLQPFVENSILHGILPLNDKLGKIDIEISRDSNHLKFIIRDNGVGIEQSLKQKSSTKDHVSKGMLITKERLNVLKKVHNDNAIDVIGPTEIKDAETKILGTEVLIILPIIEYIDHNRED